MSILIKKLNNLKGIKADSQWKSENRTILLNQILNSTNAKQEKAMPLQAREDAIPAIFTAINFLKALPSNFAQLAHRPAVAVFVIILIMFSAGMVSAHSFSKSAKPNDSLYIAKIISEKAQLAVTFNKERKNKKTTQFANNHAKDIIEVLSDPDFNNEENKDEAEKLTQDFKKEINIVKIGLNKINKSEKKNKIENNQINLNQKQAAGSDIAASEEINNNEEMQVFSANLGKDDKGIQVAEIPNTQDATHNTKQEIREEKAQESEVQEPKVAEIGTTISTTTSTSTTIATSTGITDNILDNTALDNAEQALEHAEQLFDQEDYNSALEKLEQVDDAMQTVSQASIQNIGTSTDEVI